MSTPPPAASLYSRLFLRGLGELPMLVCHGDRAHVGNLVMDKGAVHFRDRGCLRNVAASSVAPCWDLGILGALVDLHDREWHSLTFLGPDHCTIPVDLSTTRLRVIARLVADTDENVLDFVGSVYRGFKLMLDGNLLPVVLPLGIDTDTGKAGLAVSDFRFASVPLETVLEVNALVRTAVDRHLTLAVEELELGADEFDSLFARYRP
ncbi:MAG: hypothetical protein RLW61_00525 [Gammaproteobacteria bacterium]